MSQTLHMIVTIQGETPTNPNPVLAAVNREVAIYRSKLTWWQKLLEMF